MKKIIGIFGGTFDPIHLGHIKSLSLLGSQVGFHSVYWVLSARPPHKDQVTATIEHRFAMLQLALGSKCLLNSGTPETKFIADDSEIQRGQNSATYSYTYDTASAFRQRWPDASLCLIIGADSLVNLSSWHRYQELIDLVNIIVMQRPGYTVQIPDYLSSRRLDSLTQLGQYGDGKLAVFNDSDFAVSSTQIRQQLADLSNTHTNPLSELKKQLPSVVYDYILQHQLYKVKAMNSQQIKDQVIAAVEDMKGQDIKVIDIAEISNFADYMVVVSGTSDTHVKAVARQASDSLRKQGVKPLGENGADVGEWVLVDFGDVVLHVMRPEVREYYDLEKLWDEDVRELVKKHREQQDD